MVYNRKFTVPIPNVRLSIAHISTAVNYGICFVRIFLMLLTSWNIYVRRAWDLPRGRHRRFIAPLSGFKHIKLYKDIDFFKKDFCAVLENVSIIVIAFYQVWL